MNRILEGLRVVEGSAFIAAPLGGMTLAQMGADVIRFDPIGGGLDWNRWPVTDSGRSLYWVGLNKGKRSIAINLREDEGRELARALITAPGENSGIFLTNFPPSGWLAYGKLREDRDDLIMMNILGHSDGSSAVDYTVNCAVGYPYTTGNAERDAPVNHVFPAWDAVCGVTASTGILAAERHRRLTGEGQYISLALSDVAYAMVGNFGHIAEAQIKKETRPPYGNDLYGAFGRDFGTRDGRRIMIVAITRRQWSELVKVVGMEEEAARIAESTGRNLNDEGDRFEARDAIADVVRPWVESRSLSDVETAFDGTGVCWGLYQDFVEMVEGDPRCSPANPMFQELDQPGVGHYLVPGSPLDFGAAPRETVRPAPQLGENTDEVLSTILGLGDGQLGDLHDRGIVAGPSTN
ncbi:MAG: 2-methylfumaryl-CoA isomerase [Alphaproteobacteria bacterium]|nr:2-methylfumaryl-CoA isomerase [Alphaproteobacteria bacterium]